MEVLSSFCTVFISMLIILLLLICIYLYFFSGLRALRNIKPSCYISYDKNHFDKDFEFKCEFCGSIVSSKDAKCPKCAGDFGKNKEYLSKRRAMNQKYLQYLKTQENAIEKEIDHITDTLKSVKRYKLIRHKYLNFDIEIPPVYKPATDYEFTCEYCNNKLRGRSTDKCGCSNCGASYQENLELLVHEEEDQLEKSHYEEYMKLRDLEIEQNIRNEQRDARVDEKYKTPIGLAEKKGKYIALFIIVVLMVISAGITFFILEYR